MFKRAHDLLTPINKKFAAKAVKLPGSMYSPNPIQMSAQKIKDREVIPSK